MKVIANRVLIGGILAWFVSQSLKLAIDYLRIRKWDWALLLRAGGMPSSHSAFVTATAHGIGLTMGFQSPLFALAVAVAIVVIYDATEIRRQAGRHAEIINRLVRDLFEGHPLRRGRLREVLGHSPLEALTGVFLGLLIAQLVVTFWPY